jgi:sugar phosphate isomerase/epimerase
MKFRDITEFAKWDTPKERKKKKQHIEVEEITNEKEYPPYDPDWPKKCKKLADNLKKELEKADFNVKTLSTLYGELSILLRKDQDFDESRNKIREVFSKLGIKHASYYYIKPTFHDKTKMIQIKDIYDIKTGIK